MQRVKPKTVSTAFLLSSYKPAASGYESVEPSIKT